MGLGGKKKPLFRKVNTRTHGVKHGDGGKARWDRGTKPANNRDYLGGSMHSHHRHGRDYTPLFRFLISKVGTPWDVVHKEAVERLDTPEPIYWLVAENEADELPYVRVGESSYFSGLRVDRAGCLAFVDPELNEESLQPFCSCCTHTFNGKRFTQTYTP